MDYLNRVLGIHVVYRDVALKPLPNFIHARYRIQVVTLDGKEAVFVYPLGELDSVSTVKKHLDRIRQTEGFPTVLVLDHLTYRQKEYLLRDRIPFVVDGRQIYLPFMAVYLQERGDSERQDTTAFLPSAQLLFLYYLYHGCEELQTSDAAQMLALTSTSISRATRQLEERGLIKTEKRGVQKVILSCKTPEEMFRTAKGILTDPVKRTVYIPRSKIQKDMFLSGYSALAEYSMINPPEVPCFAAYSISALEKESTARLQNADTQCALQLWRYDPGKLATGRCADRLSLALALRNDRDERIEDAVDDMLNCLWREIHDKGN